jgi:hypothetical protein
MGKGCGCGRAFRGFGAELPTLEQYIADFEASTIVDANNVRWWKPEMAAVIRQAMANTACTSYGESPPDPNDYRFDRTADINQWPPADCLAKIAREEASGSSVLVSVDAVWPNATNEGGWFDVWTAPLAKAATDVTAAYLPPVAAGGGGGEAAAPPIVPVWKQGLLLGGLGVGLLGIIWFATRPRRG